MNISNEDLEYLELFHDENVRIPYTSLVRHYMNSFGMSEFKAHSKIEYLFSNFYLQNNYSPRFGRYVTLYK